MKVRQGLTSYLAFLALFPAAVLAQSQPGTTPDGQAKEAELIQKAAMVESIVNDDDTLRNPCDKDYLTLKNLRSFGISKSDGDLRKAVQSCRVGR